MASSNIKIIPASATTMMGYELRISKLYLHHPFCETAATNWTIYDGPDPAASNVVACAQGTTHNNSGGRHICFTMVFEIECLKGSTLLVMGVDVLEGQWGIVGGTGYFNMAQGYINKRNHKRFSSGNIIELELYAVFRSNELANPYREGVKDVLNDRERGHYKQEPKHDPWRLERIKLNHGNSIVSFEYSYIDKDGVKHTEGPWGGTRVWKFDEINFGPSESLREISGTVGESEGYIVVTSLKFVTNLNTYGPYGNESGKSFSLPQKKNGTIVGFYGRSGGLLDQIGVIVRPWGFC